MKKLIASIAFLLTIVSCSKDNKDGLQEGYDKPTSLLIINEGAYAGKDGVGSVSRYAPTTNNYQKNVFGGADNKGMGGTTCFATKWQGKVYVVSKDGNNGSILSEYSDATGALMRKLEVIEGVKGNSFIVVNNKTGVLTTEGGGAIVIDMVAFKPDGVLKGSDEQDVSIWGDMMIKDNYLFVMNGVKGVLAYELTTLKSVEPVIVCRASGGFAMSKDGFVWAYYNESKSGYPLPTVVEKTKLIKINPSTLQVIETEINIPILPAEYTWRAGLLVASKAENVLFFVKSSEVPNSEGFQNSIVYKYSIDKGSVQPFYELAKGLTFIGTPLVYNPSTNSLSMLVSKSTANENMGIITIDATTGNFKNSYDRTRLSDDEKFASLMILDVK